MQQLANICFRGQCTRKVFPITESSKSYNRSGEDEKELHETALCLTKCGQQNWTGSFIRQIGNIMPTKTRDNPNQGRVYDIDGIAPGLNKMEGGGRQPFIKVKGQVSNEGSQAGKVYDTDGIFPTICSGTHGYAMGNVEITNAERTPLKFLQRNGKKTDNDYAFCVDTANTGGIKEHYSNNTSRIRRLTPKECWRLQGISDEITDKVIATGISDTQMYRGAGDATTVNVIYEIARRMS